VHPALVGEGAPSDEGTERERPHIRNFAHIIGEIRQLPERGFRETLPLHLKLEIPDHGGQIGVSAPLPVSVDRSLNHGYARPDGREAVGHSKAAVVMGVYSEAFGRDDRCHLQYGLGQVVG